MTHLSSSTSMTSMNKNHNVTDILYDLFEDLPTYISCPICFVSTPKHNKFLNYGTKETGNSYPNYQSPFCDYWPNWKTLCKRFLCNTLDIWMLCRLCKFYCILNLCLSCHIGLNFVTRWSWAKPSSILAGFKFNYCQYVDIVYFPIFFIPWDFEDSHMAERQTFQRPFMSVSRVFQIFSNILAFYEDITG